jgi:RTX calcium-binding nonapeptide repeat (4 copies)
MRKLLTAAVSVVLFGATFALAAPAASASVRHSRTATEIDGCEYQPVNVVLGGPHADRLIGSFCDDAIYGFGGNDVIRGRTGTDVLRGGRGDDRISSLGFEGTIYGGPGWDTCSVIEFSAVEVLGCEVVIEV